MSTGEDEPSSGLNGRLRPRRTNIPSPQSVKITRKPDVKLAYDKPKKTSTPSKVFPNKFDDLTNKADSPAPQILCPYCDKIFSAKQAVAKHIQSTHFLTPKQDPINCLFCNHTENDGNNIIRHMVDNHPNQYFACYDCHTRFPSTAELAEHKLNVCERQKIPYRNKLRQKTTPKNNKKTEFINGLMDYSNNDKNYSRGHGFNGIVISCELKPSHANDPTDIEDNITTNLILPSNKSLSNATVIEKNAVIMLDDFQWNKRIPPNFSFPNTDADQILSRLGVVHRSPRTSESNRREWFKSFDESTQKFEKCFDTSFYSKVASNVHENLTKFLDGSFNFNPDAQHTIKTRKSKNSVVINTVEGFPFLLASDQFNRNVFDAYMPRAIAHKHKWKWENLDNEKTLISPEQFKRDSHANSCIISLVSSLDIWTQLCIRRKFEEKFNKSPVEKKTEKQTNVGKQLKEILESRELPTSSRQIVKCKETLQQVRNRSDFPASLGLVQAEPNYNNKPAVLSGEWVRPRCYVCCACGAQSRNSRALASHNNNHHPNAQIEHYEIVGEVLLNSDILKHLYVPPSQINNRSRPLRGFKECTKCNASVSLDDLHQHMLDCAGDTPTVRRKCRYRPFGMRKRRPRLPDNTIRKKMRKDIRSRHSRKNHLRPRQKIRTEVGDAETIRKMLADLPAKRHRVMVNPLNPIMRPRRKLNKQRNKLVMKKRIFDEAERKESGNESAPENSSGGDEPNKTLLKQVDHKTIKTYVKRVASKLLRHKDSLTKKVAMRRSRKGTLYKEPRSGGDSSDTPLQPTDGDNQNEQRSIDNNPERANINDRSYNMRKNSNNDNGSNNKDGPSQGRGENNNSENNSAPTQNVPLKHSIARLTGNSESNDTSLQFYHHFLLHKQSNDTTQHLPSEERMLFENEAVVTKLDKPPLHFSHQEQYLPIHEEQYVPIHQGQDLSIRQEQYLPVHQEQYLPIHQEQYLPIHQEQSIQSFVTQEIDCQRNKFNRRKGLNDCIAMLKNKLVEPNMGSPPGHLPVQCGTDEPLDTGPPPVERRYSTTDVNIDSLQRSMLMHYHDKSLEEVRRSCHTSTRVTRRSHSARGQSRNERHVNDYLQWKLCYENQMFAAQKNYEQYARRDTGRRRSVISSDELAMHRAMSLDLASKHLSNLSDYPYPKPVTHQKSPRQRRQDRSKSRTKTTNDTRLTQEINSAILIQPPPRSRRNSRRKADSNSAQVLNKKVSNKQNENMAAGSLMTVENIVNPYPQHAVSEDRSNILMESSILAPNTFPDEQSYQNALLYPNGCVTQYNNESDMRNFHYNFHNVESIIAAPLDLSNRPHFTEQEPGLHYVSDPQYCSTAYDGYETLDLSKRHSNQIMQRDSPTLENREDIVDLRVNYMSHLDHSSNLTSLPQNMSHLGHSSNLTSLPQNMSHLGHSSNLTSLPQDISQNIMVNNYLGVLNNSQDDCYPTDLSVKRTSTEINSYENRLYDNMGDISMIQDMSHSMMHNEHMCTVEHVRDDYMVNEEPTDLSHRRNQGSNSLSEEQGIHPNIISNNLNLDRNDVPADLSARSQDRGESRLYMDSQNTREYYENATVNNETGSVHNTSGTLLSVNCMPAEQLMDVHYDSTSLISKQTKNTRLRTIVGYPNSKGHRTVVAKDETQNISTSNLISPLLIKSVVTPTISNTALSSRDSHKEVTYSHMDESLNLTINSVPNVYDRNLVQNETESNLNVYDHNHPTVVAPNVTPYQQIESLNAVKENSNNLPADHNLSSESSETDTHLSSVSSSLLKLNKNGSKKREQEETADIHKHISIKRSPFSNGNPSEHNKKRQVESNKNDSLKPILDNDPETARKIAMLPKELLEIIGNMPIDHCKQLLNVLPQYVSTSSTSISNNNKSIRNETSNLIADLTSPMENNKELEIEYKSETKVDLGQNSFSNNQSSQIPQLVDISPSTVSSSILLTPPTPQLVERSQSHEVNDTSVNYRRKSRNSTDDQTPLKRVESEKVLESSNVSLVKRLKLDENDMKDHIIDLTIDEMPKYLCYTSDPSISSIPLPSAPPLNAQKANSEKTASLRAVRIKAPSERHKSNLTKSTELKGTNDVNTNMNNDDEEKNKIGNTTPMAIQQAEISSTQHRTMSRASLISPTFDQSYKEENFISAEQQSKEKDKQSELDKNDKLHHKQNIVTSSLTKNVKIDKNIPVAGKDNLRDNSVHVIDVLSSKKSNTDSELCGKDNLSTKNTICGKQTGVALLLKEHSVEDDDSEDDVTLAVIVKKKSQKEKSVSDKMDNKKIKNSIESDEIPQDSSSQCKNGLLFADMSHKETDKTKNQSDLSEISENRKDTKAKEDTLNEKVTSAKRKSRKGRKVINLNFGKFVEQKDRLCHTIAENEINKVNNLSSKIVNNMESVDDLVNINVESDTCLLNTSIQTYVNIDQNISNRMQSNRKEEGTEAMELSAECSTEFTRIQECNQSFQIICNKKTNYQETSKVKKCSADISSNASSVSQPVNEDKCAVMEQSKIKNWAEKPEKLASEDLNKADNIRASNVKTQSNVEETIHQDNESLPINKLTFVDTYSDKLEVDEKEEANMMLLRRSRRGQSLFIDNTSNPNENSLQVETPTEQRAPLTKKQLIFSKLLLDEENHNKSSIITLKSQKQTDKLTVDKQPKDSYEFTCDSDIEQEPLHKDQYECNKQKKSPLFIRKSKKKRPLTNLLSAVEDNDVTSVEAATLNNNGVAIITADSEMSIPHVISPVKCTGHGDKEGNEIDKIHTESNLLMEDSSNIQNLSKREDTSSYKKSTEKRKSSSPFKSELLELPCYQPKKIKFNNEENKETAVTCVEKTEVINQVQNKDNNEGVTAIVVSRNTPCYNKPAARRARSKSVVVKSSGADLYDPYDINLEDMVEKTEPYVSKELPTKIDTNPLKSSIVIKTRKLSKTAPSAIIDISPSNCSDIKNLTKQNMGNHKLIKDKNLDQSNKINNNVKGSSSDSDDSSKSDVPLTKYVEEKEKKLSAESEKLSRRLQSNDNSHNLKKIKKTTHILKSRNKNKRVQSINNKQEEIHNKEENEKELRSEKFMESFGFFSERKPRKSNLLATKKISETFHIIANESDDLYSDSKERNSKKGTNEAKKEEIRNTINKKSMKRGRKKKNRPPPKQSFCHVCKRIFRRFDNYGRHKISLIHITRLSEVWLKLKTAHMDEEPNYLIAFKHQLDRFKILQSKIAKRKINCISTADIILPTLDEILTEVKRTISDQMLSRCLSSDQELFIDCCEMLKESHKKEQGSINKRIRNCNSFNCAVICQEELALLERSISDNTCDLKSDDVDSVTAKNILESEEIRNLENDLIFNLREASKFKGFIDDVQIKPPETNTSNEEQHDEESHQTIPKPQIEIKDKMYPDIAENIDMFEDKFDKIKRKCRSQAAAAKQTQTPVELNLSHKNRKKSEKKKGKKDPKKFQGTVPTKGALKGFDGVKVSIPTSDINMSAIVPSVENSSDQIKTTKKSTSKKKEDTKNSDESSKSDSDNYSKEAPQKKVDVYEFMDTEDTELFEFRPSTLMERFKFINNKDVPSTSKQMDTDYDFIEISSESGSDGDDFVYMSDDFLCSDDETENSMLSCELATGSKKSTSLLKRKDVTEKNAVMGKIFKHNAVRSEISPKRRETPKPTNLDQLFDSLLQEQPIPSSAIKTEDHTEKDNPPILSKSHSSPSPSPSHVPVQTGKCDEIASKNCFDKSTVKKDTTHVSTLDKTNYPATSSKKRKSITPPRKLDLNLIPNTIEYKLLAPNRKDHFKRCESNKEHRDSSFHINVSSKKCGISQFEEDEDTLADEVSIPRHEEPHARGEIKEQSHVDNIYPNNKQQETHRSVQSSESLVHAVEDAGVARQRARRKCAVGKQNVLAETWSSESEPDGVPPRPNSAESVIGGGRKKRGRKKDMWCVRKVNRVVKRVREYESSSHRSADEKEPEPQQHGWIVGSSHKKLVTMLAHAKGRKRNDDKRPLLE